MSEIKVLIEGYARRIPQKNSRNRGLDNSRTWEDV